MYSEALSQMHLPHSHLPWLLQMPWEGRGDGQHPRAIVDTQRHWESARRQLPVALSFGHWVDLQQACLVWSSLVQAGQDLPLDCRCRCRCSWDTRSPALPSRSRTHTRPWSSDRDLRRERRNYPGPSAVPPPWPCLQLSCFVWGAKGLQTDSTASSLHICKHRVPAAHRQSLNPPCQCHQPRDTQPVPPGQSRAQHIPQLGDAGGGGAVLTIAEEAGGAWALQDVVLAERPVEALYQVLGVALALPAQALAPARARLHIPRADAGFVVGRRRRGAVARVPSPGGEEMVLREAGAESRTAGS